MQSIEESHLWEECVDALCALDSEELEHTHKIHHFNNNGASDGLTMMGQDLYCSRIDNCKHRNWEECVDKLCPLSHKQTEELEHTRRKHQPNHFVIKTDADDKVSKRKDQSFQH